MKCEKCENDHNGDFGSGRFCSRTCANTKNHSTETKNKISASIRLSESANFKSQEHRDKFVSGAKKANEKWIQTQLNSLMDADYSTLSVGRLRKRVILEQGSKCNHCGIVDWNGKALTLELEHIDGDHHNNARENVEAICPNCHSQTATFRGKNINLLGIKKTKTTDDMVVEAFIATGNIRQCLLKLGLAAKGANYGRVKNALSRRNIAYDCP